MSIEMKIIGKPKDRDFVETVEGLLFCLVGYLHPPTGYTAYLKYVPMAGGKWSKGRVGYRRALSYYHVMEVEKTFGFLREHYPQYLFNCPVRNITISTVPRERVKQYYVPEERLQEIMTGSGDKLEEEVHRLVEFLSDLSGVAPKGFGVTGSVLLGTHNPLFSDIDLTILGVEAAQRLKAALTEARGRGGSSIGDLTQEKREKWIREKTERFPLTREEAALFLKRRWNYGYWGDRYFSIHPIRLDDEIDEEYGDRRYTPLGIAEGRGTVTSSRESIFLPAVYRVENLEVQGWKDLDMREIVSYEGLYSDVVREGETASFKGLVEQVETRGKDLWHRILIGSTTLQGKDYIRPLTG
jgi:hypothetical protein